LADMYLAMLNSFGFDEMQVWIASISALLFTSNFLGGVLSGLTFVYSRKLEQRPLKERISFRLFGFSELILIIFIFFYHVFMIELITTEHIIYWASAIMMMPLLAVISSQLVQVSFSARIDEKKKKLEQIKIKKREAVRAKRNQGMDGEPPARTRQPGKNPLRR